MHARLAAELEERVRELGTARRELSLLGGKLEERDVELESVRALRASLGGEHQSAIDAIKTLQKALKDRDQAIDHQAVLHNAKLESHVQALDSARQLHREAIERREADLAAMGEQHGKLQEELRVKADLCTQLQDRIVELEKAQARITSEYQSAIEFERTKEKEPSGVWSARPPSSRRRLPRSRT